MKFIFKIFLSFFLIYNTAYSDDKIAYLDIDYILSNSNKGKIIIEQLEDKNKNNVLLLENKEKELKKIEFDIENKKNILSEKELNNKINDLKNKILTFRKEKNDLTKEFNDYRKKEISSLLKLINPLIYDYVQKNSINIVLDKKNILIGKKSYDITEEILKLVNKNIK